MAGLNKRQDIIDVTIELYHLKGDSASLGDIAEAVGCSKTLILHYFGSRKGLMSSCFDSICHEIRLRFDLVDVPEDDTDSSMKEHMCRLWTAYLDYLRENPPKARFFIQYSHGNNPLPSKYKTPEAVMRRVLGERFDGLADNEDRLFEMAYMMAVANGIASFLYCDSFRMLNTDDLAERCLDLMMNGLFDKDG